GLRSLSRLRKARARHGRLLFALRRHEFEPGIEHVSYIDFAGRILAATPAVLSGEIALLAAADLEPFRSSAGKPEAYPVVDFKIVGEHEGSRPVHDIGKADGVLEHACRGTLEPKTIGMHHGLVDADRMHHPQLLKLAHEREVRIDVTVPAPHLQNLFCSFFAVLGFHGGNVVAEHRILESGHQLCVIVIVAKKAVAVWISPDADVGLPEAVGSAVLAHLPDGDLA